MKTKLLILKYFHPTLHIIKSGGFTQRDAIETAILDA